MEHSPQYFIALCWTLNVFMSSRIMRWCIVAAAAFFLHRWKKILNIEIIHSNSSFSNTLVQVHTLLQIHTLQLYTTLGHHYNWRDTKWSSLWASKLRTLTETIKSITVNQLARGTLKPRVKLVGRHVGLRMPGYYCACLVIYYLCLVSHFYRRHSSLSWASTDET